MDSDSDIIYDSEPDRLAESTKPLPPRNHLRRTSDERPTLSSEGSTAELEKVRARRKPKIERQEKSQEVLVLDSGSENDQEATITKSRFFREPDSPPKRRRTRSPPAIACGDTGEDEGWPFSGDVKIGSRSPPPASRRSTSRSPSVSFSSASSSREPARARLRHPIASTSKVSRTSKTPSPFTSARDLLNSRPTPPRDPLEYSPSPDEPTTKPSRRSKPTSTDSARARSKPKSKPLKETLSASSIEIVESDDLEKGREQPKKGRGKGKQATEVEEGEMSDDLISPETWADQFKFKKDKTTKKGSRRVKEKEKEEVSGGSMSESQRKKPWEVLEAKFDPAAKKKKVGKIAVGKEAKKEEIGENESEDLEELEVFASNSSLSTALEPWPSGRLSHLGLDSAFVKKKPRTKTEHESLDHETLFDAPPPLVLPSDDRLKCLSHCPLCAFASTHDRARIGTDSWGSKSLASRQTHLRNCAKSHDYHSSTVSHLVNQQILILSTESEEKRLERDLGKTLFDRAIGKGEGTGGGKQVTVTGVEGSTAVEGDKEWFDDLRGVQEEIDGERKKIKRGGIEERLKRNAKEIRQELEKNAKKEGTGTETEYEVEEDGEGYAMPRPTGRLRPETEEDRDQVAKRAKELLDLANGTQLTRKSFLVIDEDTSMDAQGQDQDDLFLPPPPATQPFEDSTLAKRCQHDGAINVVRPLAASTPGRSAPGFQDLDLALSSDEEYDRPRTSSLWKANAGNEETYLSRVVYSSPVHSGSPPRRQLPRTSSPLVSPASALNPHLSTLTLSSSSSTSSISSSLPDPSFLMRRFDSSRGLVTSRRKSQSPSPSTGRRRVGRPRKESTSSNGEVAVEILGSGDEGEQGGGAGEMEWMDVGDEGWNMDGGMLVGGAGMSSDAEGAASSEEEPLATVLARTPINSIRKKKRKSPSPVNASPAAKTQPARKRISPSSEPESPHALSQGKKKVMATTKRSVDPPDMPAYSSLPLTTLHKEVQKYGYRPSKEKSVVVQQLKEIWKAINQDKVEAWERGEVEEVAKKTRAKGKKKVTEGEEAEEPKKTKGRRRRRIAPDESGDDEEVEGETRTVGERLRELIVNDTDLYLRILRYEPIHLDEFILLAANNNVKVARQLLIRCLDEQSITFYQEDPTNGQRARHK